MTEAAPPQAPPQPQGSPALSSVLYDAAKALGGGRGGLGPARLRQVQVLSRDPATLTCTVALDGDPTSPVPCGLLTPAVVPVVNAWGWAFQNDTDLLLAGTDAGAPHVRLWRSTDQNITNDVDTNISFSTAISDTQGMWNGTTTITFAWPGVYSIGGQLLWPSSGATDANREGRLRLNGTLLLARDVGHFRAADPRVMTNTMATERRMAAGDTLTLEARQTGTGGLLTTTATEHAPVLYATWKG